MATFALYSLELALSVVGALPGQLSGFSTETGTATAHIEQVAVPALRGVSTETATALAEIAFGPSLSGSSVESLSSIANITGDSNASMTVRSALDDILRVWGLCCDDEHEECVKGDALQVLNGSMQFIFLHGKALPFLAKRTRTYFVEGSQRHVALESDVQALLGNVRYADTAMAIKQRAALPGDLASMAMPFATGGTVVFTLTDVLASSVTFAYGTDYTSAETLQRAIQARILNDARVYVTYRPGRDLTIAFDATPTIRVPFTSPPEQTITFGDAWKVSDGSDEVIAADPDEVASSQPFVALEAQSERDVYTSLYGTAAPPAYYVQCDQSNGSGDSSRTRLDLANLSGDPCWISMDVLVEPQRVSWSDYTFSATLPFPHRYIESLLLPICRYKATCARRYRQKERHQSVVEQYQEALRLLGFADPQLPVVKEGRAEA